MEDKNQVVRVRRAGDKTRSRVIMRDAEVCSIVTYVHYSLYMDENYEIKMSTPVKVKCINALLHILGLFESSDYLEYMLSDMEHVYIKRTNSELSIKIHSDLIHDICGNIAKLYSTTTCIGANMIEDGEPHSALYTRIYEYLKAAF